MQKMETLWISWFLGPYFSEPLRQKTIRSKTQVIWYSKNILRRCEQKLTARLSEKHLFGSQRNVGHSDLDREWSEQGCRPEVPVWILNTRASRKSHGRNWLQIFGAWYLYSRRCMMGLEQICRADFEKKPFPKFWHLPLGKQSRNSGISDGIYMDYPSQNCRSWTPNVPLRTKSAPLSKTVRAILFRFSEGVALMSNDLHSKICQFLSMRFRDSWIWKR